MSIERINAGPLRGAIKKELKEVDDATKRLKFVLGIANINSEDELRTI